MSQLRAHLAEWLERVEGGDEVVVTDRGTPVARIIPIDCAPRLDELAERGVISKPTSTTRVHSSEIERVDADGEVSAIVSEQRSG